MGTIVVTNKEEWKTGTRKNLIGASEISAILGLSSFTNIADLWEQKKGLKPEEFSLAFAVGNAVEDVLINRLESSIEQLTEVRSRSKIEPNSDTFANEKLPAYYTATPDGFMELNGIPSVVEIKFTKSAKLWSFGLPQMYKAQVQWQMFICDKKQAVIYKCLNANGWDFSEEVFVEAYDPAFIDLVIPLVDAFMKSLEVDENPYKTSEVKSEDVWVGSSLYVETETKNPEDFIRFKELKADISKFEQQVDQGKKELEMLKDRILGSMGERQFAILPDGARIERRKWSKGSYTVKPSNGISLYIRAA